MYIGFVGTGGAGKSTIARAVRDKLIARGYSVEYYAPFFSPGRSVVYKAWWAIYLWRWSDARLLYFFIWQQSPRPLSRNVWWRIYLAHIYSYYLSQVRAGRCDVLIYDEDLAKWCGKAVHQEALQAETVAAIYQDKIIANLDDVLLVTVDTPVSDSVERFVVREARVGIKKDRATVKAEWDVLKGAAAALADEVATQTDAESIVVDGTAPPEENAQLVVELVEAKRTP